VSYRSGAMSTGWNGAILELQARGIARKTLSNSDITVASARPQGSTGRSRPAAQLSLDWPVKGSLVCQIWEHHSSADFDTEFWISYPHSGRLYQRTARDGLADP
jgi:hypothetical protein